MTTASYDLANLKPIYESLLDFICSHPNNLQLSRNISNIWKSNDENFLKMVHSFFIDKDINTQRLVPTSAFYTSLVNHFERTDDKEFLRWVKSFNSSFLSRIKKGTEQEKKEPLTGFSKTDDMEMVFQKISQLFHRVQSKNKEMENEIITLKKELLDSKLVIANFTSSIDDFMNEERENFRKRIRSISNYSVCETSVV